MANKNQKVLSMALAALMAAGTITSAAPVANAAAKKPSAAAVKAATANYNAGVNKIAFAENYFAKYNMTSDSNVKYVQKYVDLAKTYLVKLPAGAQKNALTARINKMTSQLAVQRNINTKFAQGLKYVNTGLGFDLTVAGNVDTAAKYLATANTYLNLLPEGQAKDILAQKVAKLDVNIKTAQAGQDEVALKAAAEKAVADLETAVADLTTQAKVDAAKTAKTAADAAVAKVADKTALQTRIDAAQKKITDAEAALAVLKVDSASAINAAQVRVTFSKALDKDTAEDEANYTLDNAITVVNASLQADGKTVVLTTSALTNGKTYKVTVGTGVKDAGKVALSAKAEQSFVATDVAVPTVVSVTAKGNSAVVVKFSEPVNNLATDANFKINGTVFSGTQVVSDDLTTIELPAALPQGENTLEIVTTSTLADFASYKVPYGTFKFNVTNASTVAQAVSAEVKDQSTVRVTFDQPVTLKEATDYSANFYWNVNGTEGYRQYSADNTNTVSKVDDKTFDVKFTGSANYLRTGNAYFFTTGVADYYGNITPNKKLPITVTAEAVPTVSEIEATAEDTIEVTFDKSIDSATVKKANFTVKNPKGETVDISNVSYNSTDKKVTITLDDAQSGGDYTVDTANLKSVTGNAVTAAGLKVTITDKTAISSISIGAVDTTNDYILVKYPEDMSTSGNFSIGDRTKYRVEVSTNSGTSYTAVALASADDVTVVDNRTVKIKFAANTFANGGTNRVRVTTSLVADALGNVNASPVQAVATPIAAASDNLSIAGVAPKIKDTKTITLTVDRELTSVSVADFIVKDLTDSKDIMPIDATYSNDSDDHTSVVTLKLGSDLDLDNTYKVATNASIIGTKDINDLYVKNSDLSNSAVNYIAPKLDRVSLQDKNHLVVEFDKAVSMVVASDFKVTDGTNTYVPTTVGSTTANTSAAAVNTNGGAVYVLTFAAGNDITSSAKVSTVASPQTEDSVDNKLATASNVAVNDFKVTSVALTDVDTTGTILATDKIVLTFNEEVDAADLIADIDPFVSTVTAATAWDGTEKTFDAGSFLTFTDGGAGNDTLSIGSIATVDLGATNVVTGNVSLNGVKVSLSDDGKTMTITLGTNTYTEIDASKITGAKLTPAATLKADSGNYVDTGYNVYTASKF